MLLLLLLLWFLCEPQAAAPALTPAEQCELARQLDLLSQRCEVALHPGPLALDNGTIIPPVPWTLLPRWSPVFLFVICLGVCVFPSVYLI